MNHSPQFRPYFWLLFISCAVAGGEYYFYRFSFDPLNPYQLSRGITFACAIWSSVLLVAMFLHQPWARYVMIFGLVFALGLFGLITLLLNEQSVAFLSGPTKESIKGMALFGLALIPLGVCPSLRRHLSPRTAGGRTPT